MAGVSVDANRKLTLHRVVVAGDIGPIVNMSGAENQVEGGVIDGFSTAMGVEIGFENGRITQNNFDSYPILRITHAPKVESYFIGNDFTPTGVSERDFCRDRTSRQDADAGRIYGLKQARAVYSNK